MRKNIFLSVLLLLSMSTCIIFFSGCGKKDEGKIKIGVVLPMTGDLASFSEPLKTGMEFAIRELNNKNNNKMELVFVDSKADPTTAINGLQKLLNVDKVNYVIGDVSSPVTLALVPIIEKNKAFLLSPGASSPKLDNISSLFARNYPSSVIESYESAKYLANKQNILKTALIYVNSEYGLGLRDVFTRTYKELGGEIIFTETFDIGRTNFRNIIIKMKEANPEAIYLGGNQKEMGSFMRQLRESGSRVLVISNISFLEADCLNIAKNAADGVIVPVAYYNPIDTIYKSAFNFAKLVKEKLNKEVTVPIAVGYDAIMLIAKGIEKFGDNPEKVASYIRNLKNYDGALGLLNFTDGDVRMPVEFKIVKNGKSIRISDK